MKKQAETTKVESANGDSLHPQDAPQQIDAKTAEASAKACQDEFARYWKERETLAKTELEAEKNFDTLLVTLSTGVMGASYLLFKDATKSPSGVLWLVLSSWIFFGLCLFSALVDRLLTYISHQKLRNALDAEFTVWKGLGAVERGVAIFKVDNKWIRILPPLKWVCFGTFGVGVILLSIPILYTLFHPAPTAPQQPIVVNLNQSVPQVAPQISKGDKMGSEPKPTGQPALPRLPLDGEPILPAATVPRPTIIAPAPPLDIGAGSPILPAPAIPIDTTPKPTTKPNK